MSIDVAALADQLALHVKATVTPLQERLAVLEATVKTLSLTPGPPGPAGKDGTPGPAGADGKDGAPGAIGRDGRDGMPGPMGPAGKDGLDGKDGAAGLNGKDGAPGVAGMTYQGIFQLQKNYEKGDVVTYDGSMWHCQEPTSARPSESKAWMLAVKHGRDGKDGRDAVSIPVVKVG